MNPDIDRLSWPLGPSDAAVAEIEMPAGQSDELFHEKELNTLC